MLRARGSLQGGVAARQAAMAEFDAREAADLAKKGLRRCALPSCGKQETTVLQFRICGHCQRGVHYCCPEHAKQHWPVHKREGGEPSDGGGAGAA